VFWLHAAESSVVNKQKIVRSAIPIYDVPMAADTRPFTFTMKTNN